MTLATFVAFTGVYPDLAAAEADYDLVKGLHSREGCWTPTTPR